MYSPKRNSSLLANGNESELREQLADAQRQLAALKEAALKSSSDTYTGKAKIGIDRKSVGDLERQVGDVRKQLALESQLVADLKASKAALEGIIAAKSSNATGADSTLVDDLRAQLEKKKAEVVELNLKKNKYKKHAKNADQKVKEMKKVGGGASEGGNSEEPGLELLKEVEELRTAKTRLEKKLKASKKDYDDLEKEVLALEDENQLLEEELKKVKG